MPRPSPAGPRPTALPAALRAALPVTALLSVTAVWGSTFIILKGALDHVGAADFLAVRFSIAAAVMVGLTGARLRLLGPGQWARGLGLGALYGTAQLLQTVGLRTTDASVSGFITGMYVVLTPLIVLLMGGAPLGRRGLLASGTALAGLACLSLSGTALSPGAMITLAGSMVYALHIVALGRVARGQEAMVLTATQMVGIALVCAAAALPGGIGVPATARVWGPVLYMALASGILTMLLQTWAQARMSPTRAAVIMTCEPVFAALFAVALGDESLSARLLVGGGLILVAMLLSELPGARPGGTPPRGPDPGAGGARMPAPGSRSADQALTAATARSNSSETPGSGRPMRDTPQAAARLPRKPGRIS